MTRIDTILAETARREIEGLTAAQAVERITLPGIFLQLLERLFLAG